MSSYKIIFGVILVFITMALVLGAAGIDYTGAAYDKIPNQDVEQHDQSTLSHAWTGFCNWWWGGAIGTKINPPGGGGMGVLWDMATFSVPGMPAVISWAMWFLLIMFTTALIRIAAGTLLGGGG